MNYFLVFIGGGLGATLRYLLSQLTKFLQSDFPWIALIINMLGCCFFGMVMAKSMQINKELVIFLTVGLCGGFTTLSSFSYDIVNLLQQQKIVVASLYIIGTFSLSILSSYIGYTIVK